MRRTLTIILCMLFGVFAAQAQDRIYFIDSHVVNAVIDEVGHDLVYYRLYENQNGPVYSTPVADISKIIYHEGHEQNFLAGSIFNEDLLKNAGGQAGTMRFVNGKLYIGSRTYYGAQQAEYVAFNMYGDDYFMARQRRGWGHALTWLGTSMFSLATLAAAINLELEPGMAILMGAGAVGMGAGIPLICSGNRIMKGIATDYNTRVASSRQPELTFGQCSSGVGLALNF